MFVKTEQSISFAKSTFLCFVMLPLSLNIPFSNMPSQSLTPSTVGNAALSSPSIPTLMPNSLGSVLSSSGSGGRERDKKSEGHQDASVGALPQPVACHPTPTALLPLILPAESPHPAPRKQIIMGRPGTGKQGRGRGNEPKPLGFNRGKGGTENVLSNSISGCVL